MSNWRNQIQDHTHPDQTPRVLIYHGAGKKEAAKLSEYDVVVTSYGALAMEYKPDSKATPTKGLFSLKWRRVVLDEGHTIRNPRSKGSSAACALLAESRWTLTGTPIINTLKDLYSQIRFLKLTGGLEEFPVFNSVLIRPLMSDDPDSRLLLQALMSTICLRRRKDMSFVNLRLPSLTSRVLRIKFHAHEQEKYDMFQYVSLAHFPLIMPLTVKQIRSQRHAPRYESQRQNRHNLLPPPRSHPPPPPSL
jgi:SWI/SNF-related matrix-associated actin-dependent regulator of chromatin subfamily A3